MTPNRKRPEFIWTPHQPVNPMGFIAVMQGAPPREDGKNRFFLFRRSFDLPASGATGALSITVDGRYQLFVNGIRIGRGPVRCSPLFQRYDDHDLTPHLHSGRNVIAVLVHTYGVDTAFYESAKGMWRPTFGEGGLWVMGHAGDQIVDSDAHWRCLQSDAWTSETPRMNSGLGFIEEFDARRLPADWAQPGHDDSEWLAARPMVSGGGSPESAFGGIATRPFPTLLPRGIPQLAEAHVRPQSIIWTAGQVPAPALPIARRLYEEKRCALPEGAIAPEQRAGLISGTAVRIKTIGSVDTAILFDFGRIVTGCLRIEIDGLGGEIIEIAVSEKLPGEWEPDGPAPEARITPEPLLGLDAHVARYIARPGAQVFERFEWGAIRWMHLVIRNAPRGLVVRSVGATALNYPVEERGRFACSDNFLTRLWAVGAYTLRQCMHDAWEDCPGREQRQWLGDATVENLAAIAAFGTSAAALNAKFLEQVAESQRPDGLTQMFAPGDHATDGLLIPDWTLQWILNAGDHYRHTGDLQIIERIFPAIQKALAWFDRQTGPNGLIADLPYWHFMDWAAVGRHGEAAALNAQLSGALRVAALLAEALEWPAAAARYTAQSARISAALEERHWDDARGIWVDMTDPVTGAQDPRCSQHATAAITLWCESDGDRRTRALDRITDTARLIFTAAPPIVPSGAPLDPREGVVLANTFYAHFVYEALAAEGRLVAVLDLMRARFGPMLARGATTLWESFEPTASLCHGFSASPTWQLSHHVLGVFPASPGYATIGFSPDIAGLEWAEGVFPTPHGDVIVRLDQTATGFIATVKAPPTALITPSPATGFSMRDHCIIPGGFTCIFERAA